MEEDEDNLVEGEEKGWEESEGSEWGGRVEVEEEEVGWGVEEEENEVKWEGKGWEEEGRVV